MTTTRLDVIDRSVEKTHIWLNELSEELATDDGHHSYRVLRAFLHAAAAAGRVLARHLSPGEAASVLPGHLREFLSSQHARADGE